MHQEAPEAPCTILASSYDFDGTNTKTATPTAQQPQQQDTPRTTKCAVSRLFLFHLFHLDTFYSHLFINFSCFFCYISNKQICQNPATGTTAGFDSCNPCKKFFQRHRKDRITELRCELGGRHNCDLTKRRPCTKCRLMRCLYLSKTTPSYFLKDFVSFN